MTSKYDIAAELSLNARRWTTGLDVARRGTKGFVDATKREMGALRDTLGSVEGRLAQIGLGFSAVQTAMKSAQMDKSLRQLANVANASDKQIQGLRTSLFEMSRDTGNNLDDLQLGFSNLVQSGMEWNQSLKVIRATNDAMAVTGARADDLTNAMSVAANVFDIDLSKGDQAKNVIDKMAVAAGKGSVELSGLSAVLSRLGSTPKQAGFDLEKTLAFVESLSFVEKNEERLATLAQSTMRVFTNDKYMQEAQKATGVQFFNKDRSRRGPDAIFSDLRTEYSKLNDDLSRHKFVAAAFGIADLDTQKGAISMMSGNVLDNFMRFDKDTRNASNEISSKLDKSLDNAVNQAGRLKAVLGEAADRFAQPINKALADGIGLLINDEKNGGLGLSGEQLAGGAALAVLGGYAGKRAGGAVLGKVLNSSGANIGAGVVTGKALEAAGVQSVYVVNMPAAGMMPGVPAADLATKAGPAKYIPHVAAGVVGYAVGTEIYDRGMKGNRAGDVWGAGIANATPLGVIAQSFERFQKQLNKLNSSDTITRIEKNAQFKGEMTIVVNGEAKVQAMKTSNKNIPVRASTGRMMSGGM